MGNKEVETLTPDVTETSESVNPFEAIQRDINFYESCKSSAYGNDLTGSIHSYAMINTTSTVSTTFDWVNQLLHQDGKNRKVTTDVYGTVTEFSNPEEEEVDRYYQTALTIAINQFLAEQRTSMYYEMYAQAIAIFLISEGMKGMLDNIEFPDSIKQKTEDVLIELDDRLQSLVISAKRECEKLQPELYERFIDLDVNLLNEPTGSVVGRWFTREDGTKSINEDLYLVLQGLRTEYLRYVKKNGKVELSTLLSMFGVISSTYNRYKKDMINKVIPKCDASLMSYVKYLLLNNKG